MYRTSTGKNTSTSSPCSVPSTLVIATPRLWMRSCSKCRSVSTTLVLRYDNARDIPNSWPIVALCNLATHTASWGPLAQRLCNRFGYDKVVSGTSGSEATDTAVKIARKWGILRKEIPAEDMLILGVGDSFHGLTSGVWNLQNSTRKRAGKLYIPWFRS